MLHKNMPLGDGHIIHNWEAANLAARNAVVVTAADKGKLLWQIDTNAFYFLANDVGPVWLSAIGVQGTPGYSVLSGAVVPAAGTGVNGDFYINTATSMIYGPKAAGVWPAGVSLVGAAGTNGTNGFSVLSGTVAPVAGNGVNGDFFINTATSIIYGPKATGAWPVGVSLVGATGAAGTNAPKILPVACSDEVTALGVGLAKVTFRMPYNMTLSGIRASLTTAQATGASLFTVDVKMNAVSILSTKISINNAAKSSVGATTPPVISTSALTDDAEITIDITLVGDGTAKGLKVYLIGT